MSSGVSRRGVICAMGTTPLFTFSLVRLAAAEPMPISKWFRYGAEVDKFWAVSGDPAKPMQFSITRKGMELRRSSQRVLVLYPRPSSAYDVAITKILQVFESKALDAQFTVVNFQMDDARGKEAIKFAEANEYDLIFAMGSESTAWLYDHYRGGPTPVVSVCSKDPVQLGQMADYKSGSRTNFAFTSLNVPVDVQMTYVKELSPDLKTLTVLVDSKNVSAVQTQAEPIASYARQRGIQGRSSASA
jgi:putative tryptophan/tyrosine transport system substrate-binding protein